MNVYCEQCGAALPPDGVLKFCTACGTNPVDRPAASRHDVRSSGTATASGTALAVRSTGQDRGWPKALVAGAALMAAVIGGGLATFLMTGGSDNAIARSPLSATPSPSATAAKVAHSGSPKHRETAPPTQKLEPAATARQPAMPNSALPAGFALARPADQVDPMNMTLPVIPRCTSAQTTVVKKRGPAGFRLEGRPLYGRLTAGGPAFSLVLAKCSRRSWQLVALDHRSQFASRASATAAGLVADTFGPNRATKVRLSTDLAGTPVIWGVSGSVDRRGFRIKLAPDGSHRIGYKVENQPLSVVESELGGR